VKNFLIRLQIAHRDSFLLILERTIATAGIV